MRKILMFLLAFPLFSALANGSQIQLPFYNNPGEVEIIFPSGKFKNEGVYNIECTITTPSTGLYGQAILTYPYPVINSCDNMTFNENPVSYYSVTNSTICEYYLPPSQNFIYEVKNIKWNTDDQPWILITSYKNLDWSYPQNKILLDIKNCYAIQIN